MNRKVTVSFIILIAIAVLFKFVPMPAGVYGVTPMYAMAIFGGVIFRKDIKLAMLLPLLSFFVSDVVVEVLYRMHAWTSPGFYDGQIINYILFGLLVFIGRGIKKPTVGTISMASIIAPTAFYLLSNLSVWLMAGFYPMTAAGLKACYIAGLPFYLPYSLLSTLVFTNALFLAYSILVDKDVLKTSSLLSPARKSA